MPPLWAVLYTPGLEDGKYFGSGFAKSPPASVPSEHDSLLLPMAAPSQEAQALVWFTAGLHHLTGFQAPGQSISC